MRIFGIGFPLPLGMVTSTGPEAIPRRAIRQMTPAYGTRISAPIARHSDTYDIDTHARLTVIWLMFGSTVVTD